MPNSVDEMTERMLDDAGIEPGMRVLDIGCGMGAVSLMLSRRVGNQGHVFAVDRNPHVIELVVCHKVVDISAILLDIIC